jgi:hypothetical protein
MPIENRELAAGTRLVARYKKQDRTCEVVEIAEGLRYRLDDGTEHRSPSSAGKEITGGVAVNGWRFWSLDGDPKPRKARGEKAKTSAGKSTKRAPAKRATKSAGKKAAKKKVARAATKGDAYGCGACGETFPTMKAATKHALTHTTA